MKEALMQMLNEINAGLKTALTRVNELVAENKALKEALAQPEAAAVIGIPTTGEYAMGYAEGFNDAVTELHEGLYPLYVKPQIEVGCAECGVNGGYALYCVACAEKFVGGYKDSGVPAVETGLEQVSPDTTAPKRPWVGLTDEERNYCVETPFVSQQWANIEDKLRELNT